MFYKTIECLSGQTKAIDGLFLKQHEVRSFSTITTILGHPGAEKTLKLVSQKYWFSKMRKYVKRYISCCLACMYNKEPTERQPGFLHPIPKFDVPMHTIHIDHLGPFVTSSRKNTQLITAIDGFTKFAFLKAVRNTSVGPVLTF